MLKNHPDILPRASHLPQRGRHRVRGFRPAPDGTLEHARRDSWRLELSPELR